MVGMDHPVFIDDTIELTHVLQCKLLPSVLLFVCGVYVLGKLLLIKSKGVCS